MLVGRACRIVSRTARRFHASARADVKASITEVPPSDLKGKRVFLRVDFDVPVQDGQVVDDASIKKSLPTLQYLVDGGARVIVASEGHRKTHGVVAARLGTLLPGRKVVKVDGVVGTAVREAATGLGDGDVLMLGALHDSKGRTPEFAKELALESDFFVNDVFKLADSARPSVTGVAQHIPRRLAGLSLEREANAFEARNWQGHVVAVVGGKRLSQKAEILRELMREADTVLIGGALMFTFMVARHQKVERSVHEFEQIAVADDIVDSAKRLTRLQEYKRGFAETTEGGESEDSREGVDLVFPVDMVVAPRHDTTDPSEVQVVDVGAMPKYHAGLDIGPKTIKLFAEKLADADTILWNGPLGRLENPLFAKGTNSLIDAIATRTAAGAQSIVWGPDTVSAVRKLGAAKSFSVVAEHQRLALNIMTKKAMPGLVVLEQSDLAAKELEAEFEKAVFENTEKTAFEKAAFEKA